MKLALLSDIHANPWALEACLAHARQQGAQRIAVLGDSVGYGPDPGAVVDRLMALAADGAVVLQGNHDLAACQPPLQASRAEPPTHESQSSAWTHHRLSPAQRGFLAGLPLLACEPPWLLVHASADAPERWTYVNDERSAEASLQAACARPGVHHVFGGHVHHQRLFYRGARQALMRFDPTPGVAIPVPLHRCWLATVGSVGQPRDGDTRAMYALFDSAALQLWFHRVPYDHLAAAESLSHSGLPLTLAQRLETGQ